MLVRCTMSHEKPLGGGRFKKYKAGKEYDLEKYDKSKFKPASQRDESVKETKSIKKGGVKDAD